MSESLLLINPRRKKRRKSRRKGRMPAGLARYWASRRGVTKKRRRKRRATAKVRRRKINPMNPRSHRRRRRRHSGVARVRRRKINPRRRAHRRHRNPRFGLGTAKGFVKQNVVPAMIGAGGALSLDVLYAYASPYLPATMQTGWFATVAKVIGAAGIGFVATKALGRERGRIATVGALTVVGYGVLKQLAQQFAPTIKGLSGYADYTDYRVGQNVPGMGAYMGNPALGFYSPAAVLGGNGNGSGMGAYMGRGMSGFADSTGYDWRNDGM